MSHLLHRRLPQLSHSSPMHPAVLKVAILIVSTTAAKDPSTDTSGKILTDLFAANSNTESLVWEVVETHIVPDEKEAIASAVRRWADENRLNLVVTTGGTGFAIADWTPEAVGPLLHKEAPGLVHAMLTTSLNITPFAMMARPVAGIRNNTIIVTLPGSPKGAKENLESLIKLLPHACIQASGSTSSRALHSGGIKYLEEKAGITHKPHFHSHSHSHSHSGSESKGHSSRGHHHHHGHTAPRPHTTSGARANKLGAAVTSRHRESPYPMISVAAANDLISRETPLQEVIEVAVNQDLVGYILAEDVTAAESVPAYRASIVDGYAVVHTDGKGVYPVVSVSHAAPGSIPPLRSGEVARITTGAPLPPGATATVMVEDTELRSMTEDESEEKEVYIMADDILEGENVREVGSDVMVGDVVLRKGDVISAVGGEIGVLASVGRATVKVYKKPVVGVLSTGDEVVMHDREGGLRIGEIRDSNRPTILSTIKAWGFPVLDLGIAKDRPGALEATLREALEAVDVVITTGGVSMGELDLLKPTIEQSLQGTIHFGRVAMKPGKPTTFATVPASSGTGNKLIFALPGNPASALVTFHLFVLPSLRKSVGHTPHELPKVRVTLDQDVKLDPRPEYHRVHVVFDSSDGKLHARSTGGQRSSRIGSAEGANAVLALPGRGECGEKRKELGIVPGGETMDAILWGQIGVVGGWKCSSGASDTM